MNALLAGLVAIVTLAGPLWAEMPKTKQMRYMHLADVRKLSVDRYELLIQPSPNHFPPQTFTLLSGKRTIPFHCGIKTLSSVLTVETGTPELVLSTGNGEEKKSWLSHKLPDSPLGLGVIYHSPNRKDWNDPKLLLLDDSAEAFPKRTIRVTNVSEQSALVQIGSPKGRIFGIRPGKAHQKPVEGGASQVRLGYLALDKRIVWIWSGQMEMAEDQRLQIFLYHSMDSANPVKMHYQVDTLPAVDTAPQ